MIQSRIAFLPRHLVALSFIIVAYLTIGALYATRTPAWQVPDEPAHYNYIRALAERRAFPVLQPGDYDQQYLETLKSQNFPPALSIARIEYEDHQPPLYYLLMTPIYWVFGGSLLALRLASLTLGAGVVVCAYAVVKEVSSHPVLPLTAAGFVAFIPQHVAMMAGVNNDSLAELLLGLTLILLLRYIRPHDETPRGYVRETYGGQIGVLMGLAFLTKTTIYFLPFLALFALLVRWRQEHWPLALAARASLRMFLPALILGALWWGRDLAVYGWPDFFGLRAHNAIVVDQPRTSEWIAMYGFAEVARRFVVTTFKSWWGQFGWMGVVMDSRVYLALLAFALAMGGGFVYALAARFRSLSDFHKKAAALFALTALFSLTLYLGYNLTFVQHQGRYLFTALLPTGLAAALGLSVWADVASRLFRRSLAWLPLVVLALLAALDVFALFRFIVPALT